MKKLFDERNVLVSSNFLAQKKASYLHHTATTKYSCCVPALGDSEGASCVGLAKANLQPIFILANETFSFFM